MGHACCQHQHEPFSPRKDLVKIGIALLLFVVGLFFQSEFTQFPFHWPEYLVFLSAYFLVGWGILKGAFKGILAREPFDENFLMVVATFGAIAIHELPEAVAVILFFSLGEFFQSWAVDGSRRSIKALMDLRPEFARRVQGEKVEELSPETLSIGDEILVYAGERIPLDGVVLEGKSRVDTAALTGESVPRKVKEGQALLAGMVNLEGMLRLGVSSPFSQSAISKILRMVEQAESKKGATERFISKVARIYTPLVVYGALALATIPYFVIGGLWSDWIYRALTLLVISCPCGLVISIPLAYFVGVGKAAREGILVKGANYLDVLQSLETVVFDKTGTLTKGNFRVTEIHPRNSFSKEEVLAYAAKVESQSKHPLAGAILESYGQEIPQGMVKDFQDVAGHGIRAKVEEKPVMVGNDRFLHVENIPHDTCHVLGTVAHVVVDGTYAGYIIIADEIREDSRAAIQGLKRMGVQRIEMLTGDNTWVAEKVASELGVDHVYAELLPENKVEKVEALLARQEEGKKLAFVGDGINDAPVLTRADLGVAMGGMGADAAIETADLVIMGDQPSKLLTAISISKKTRQIIIQNIVGAFAIKGFFIFLGATGDLSMLGAVFADVGVALLAILNASRILR